MKSLRISTNQYKNNGDRSSSRFILSDINEYSVVKNISFGKIIFSILIEGDVPYSVFNLIIKYDLDYNEVEKYVARYKMDLNFGNNYYQQSIGFDEFSGIVQTFDPDLIFSLNRSSVDCLDDLPCCELGGAGGDGSPNTSTGGPTGGVNTPSEYDYSISDGFSASDCIFITGCMKCFGPTGCDFACHPGYCQCPNFKSRYFSYLNCAIPFTEEEEYTKNSDCCPGNNDVIPIHPGIDPSTVGSEEVAQDFTQALQMGLGTTNFINDFLDGINDPSVRQQVMDAAECAECKTYTAGDYEEQTESGFDYSVDQFEQCVLQSLVDRAECNSTFNSVLSNAPYFGDLELTLEEQVDLIGPTGTTDCASLAAQLISNLNIARKKMCVGSVQPEELTDPDVDAWYFKMLSFNYYFAYHSPDHSEVFNVGFGDLCVNASNENIISSSAAQVAYAKAFEVAVDLTQQWLNDSPWDDILMQSGNGSAVHALIASHFRAQFELALQVLFGGSPLASPSDCDGVQGFVPHFEYDC